MITNTYKKTIKYFNKIINRGHNLIDMRGLNNDNPIVNSYYSKGRNFLIDVPLNKCRHFKFLGYSCTEDCDSPFISTLRKYSNLECNSYYGSPLEKFYDEFQPESVADIMGLSFFPDLNEILKKTPPSGETAIWRSVSPAEQYILRKKQIEEDNLSHQHKLGAEEGEPFFGPVSERKGILEFNRLVKVYNSIRVNGYIPCKMGNHISGIVLLDDENWSCLIVSSGQHRIASLAALGYKKVPIIIKNEVPGGILRRSDVKYWPSVQNNLLTVEQALKVFDRIHKGIYHYKEIYI